MAGAAMTSASKLIVADLVDEMVDDIIIPALKMDAKYETYLLGTAFARPVIGKKLAEIAQKKGITEVVFDRGGYLYHGRVMELAEGAREGGLKF